MANDIYVVIEHLQGSISDISYVMLAAANDLARAASNRVVGIFLGQEAEGLFTNLAADEIIYIEHQTLKDFSPDAYQRTITNLLTDNNPSVILFGNTTIGSDIAGMISAKLGIQLINSCISFSTVNGTSKAICQICGGKIMVEVI